MTTTLTSAGDPPPAISESANTTPGPTPPPSSSLARVWGTVATLVAILVAFLLAFSLPSLRAEPRDVPVAIVAPEPALAQVKAAVAAAQPDAIAWVESEDRAAAITLIEHRTAVGALILGKDGLEVVAPGAAGPAVAAFVQELGERVGGSVSVPITHTDPIPFADADPRGIGLTAGALPIALGGWIAAVGIIATVRGNGKRLVAALSFAVMGGVAMTAVLQFWFGTFDGNYLALAAAGMLGIAATSLLVLGLQRLLKGVGIACAATILILFGNPLSGLTTPSTFLPRPWGEIGQWLPPGATGSLMRNTGFFDPATAWFPALVLVGWVTLGVGAYALAGVLERRASQMTAPVTAE